jgi:hypothetical protein
MMSGSWIDMGGWEDGRMGGWEDGRMDMKEQTSGFE